MRYRHIFLVLVTVVVSLSFPLSGQVNAQAEEKGAGTLFFEAFQNKDKKAMQALIKTKTKELPGEVVEMVTYAMNPDVGPEEADYIFSVAGLIAKMLGDHTGDKRLLGAVTTNYSNLLKRRDANSLKPEMVEKTKKDIATMSGGNWRVNMFRLDAGGSLMVEIDVKESSGASSFETPKISIRDSRKVLEIIKTNLPKVKKGKVSWSSMGVGLKTAFIE